MSISCIEMQEFFHEFQAILSATVCQVVCLVYYRITAAIIPPFQSVI